jgi:hypothetical protein
VQGHIGTLRGHAVFYLFGAGADRTEASPWRVDLHAARRFAALLAAD